MKFSSLALIGLIAAASGGSSRTSTAAAAAVSGSKLRAQQSSSSKSVDKEEDHLSKLQHQERRRRQQQMQQKERRTNVFSNAYQATNQLDPFSNSNGNRIVGGNQASREDYPYFVGTGDCGASLIADSVVLTAAHCPELKNKQVNVGSYEYLTAATPRFCEEYISDPNYDNFSSNNDFALCKLSSPVSADTSKVKLLLNLDSSSPASGEDLSVLGHGALSEGGSGPDFLHHVAVPYVPNDTCNSADYYGGQITNEMLCAGFSEGGKDSCQGDSGGPIVLRTPDPSNANKFIDSQVGVVSWGEGCAKPNKPGVYARTSAGSSWIKSIVCDDWNLEAEFCDSNVGVDPNDEEVICGSDEEELIITVKTDQYGYETSITLTERGSRDAILARSYLVKDFTNTHKVCLKKNVCYDFTVYDSFSDGMAEGGAFSLKLGGEVILNGNPNFESSTEHNFCTGDATGGPVSSPTTASPVTTPTTSITNPPTFGFDDDYWNDDYFDDDYNFPTPAMDDDYNFMPTTFDDDDYSNYYPTVAPSPNVPIFDLVPTPAVPISSKGECEPGFGKFKVEIQLDEYGYETFWNMTSFDQPSVLLAGSSREYSEPNTRYVDPSNTEYYCLEPKEYMFSMFDSYEDGLNPPGYIKGFVDDVEVFVASNYGARLDVKFDVRSTDPPTKSPTSPPTEAPTNPPTQAPTASPTIKPTSTIADCSEMQAKFGLTLKAPSDSGEETCVWMALNEPGSDGSCPTMCKICGEYCEDTSEKFNVWKNNSFSKLLNNKSCSWAKNNAKCKKLLEDKVTKVKDVCPKQCGKCS